MDAKQPVQRGPRFGGPEWFLVVSLGCVLLVGLLIFLKPDWVAALNARLLAGQELAVRYGLLGVFLAMLVGNLTIMIVFPTTIVPFIVAAAGVSPIAVGLASGLGAVVGEFSGYALGWLGSRLVRDRYPEAHRLLKDLVARRPRAIPVLLFIFSLLPLPDDVLFIPLGIIRYPWWKVTLPAAAGKVIAGWVIGYGGQVSAGLLADRTLSVGELSLQLAVLAGIIVFTYVLMRIPWTTVLRRAQGKP